MGCSPHARFNESSPDAAGRIWAANSAFARAGIEHRLMAAMEGSMDVGRWMLVPGLRFQTETKGFPSGGKEHPSRSQTSRGVTIIMNIIHERRAERTGAPQPNTGIAFARIHRQFCKQRDTGELQLHCAGDAVRWPFKITGLMKFLGVLLILAALSTTAQAGQSVTLVWTRSADPIVVGYNIYYGGASGAYTNKISVGNATNATISGLIQGATYYFAATTYAASGVESLPSSEVSYLVPPNAPVNRPPTLNALGCLTINSNAGPQTVNLTGITSGASNEVQTLTVTVMSSNPKLIHTPTVSYTSSNTNGTLSFAPVTNKNGTATITVTVNDGGASNNLTSQSFVVTVGLAPPLPSMQVSVNHARQFILTVTGQVSHTYDIQATQDFKTWTVIGTVTVGTTGSLNFTDTNAPSFSKRFYRTRG
jgi:hypothetical protein